MKRWVMLPAAALSVVIGLVTSVSAGGAYRPASGAPPVIGASTTTPAGSSVVIAMGHLNTPSDTFWELFLRPVGIASWVLHTPPGVASNGGLVLAASPSGLLTVGFLSSAELRFSPVAQSMDRGDHWSPGELPSSLTSTPDALAVGPTGEALAVVAASGQSVLQSSGDLSTWKKFTSVNVLARAAPSCGVREVTAVAYNAAAQPLVGVNCARQGEVGILAAKASSNSASTGWSDIGLSLGAGSGGASVTRLVSTGVGVAGLAQVQVGKRVSVVAFWGNGSSAQWTGPTSFSVPPGWSIKATATGGGSGQGLAVLLGSGERRRVKVVAGPGASWTTPPPVPRGATGVSTAGAEIDAFVVTGSHLAIWSWTEGAGGWRHSASITVPVPYGSSS
jgi:hypothetical protein